MRFRPVAARSLHRRRVRLQDTVLDEASLFPYFDAQGDVSALMLVWPASGEIHFMEHGLDLVRYRRWGEIEIGAPLAARRDVGTDAASYSALWHYDPWWVLRESRFARHPAVPLLKATNCSERFLTLVRECHFSRDLSRLESVTVKGKNNSGVYLVDHSIVRFTPDLLPARPEPDPPRPPQRDWKLDPFWLRGSRDLTT